MAAHHCHVAGVIAHAILLLVGGIVFLIDNDQAEIGIRQEQSRACADNDTRFAIRHGAPGARALARRQFRMPGRRPCAEARGEAVEKLRGQRDLRHQDQALPAAADRVSHRLEIDLGLARAGDAVEQRDCVAALRHGLTQCRRRGTLVGGEIGGDEIGIGRRRHRLGRQHHGLQRALVDQTIDHARGHAGLARGVDLPPHHAVSEQSKRAPAR